MIKRVNSELNEQDKSDVLKLIQDLKDRENKIFDCHFDTKKRIKETFSLLHKKSNERTLGLDEI